jgi:hypothetical protein
MLQPRIRARAAMPPGGGGSFFGKMAKVENRDYGPNPIGSRGEIL